MALALGWAWTNSAMGHGLCKGPEVRVTPRQVNAHLSELRRSPWGLGVCSDPQAPWVPRPRLPSLCTSLSLGKNVDVRQATDTGFQHERNNKSWDRHPVIRSGHPSVLYCGRKYSPGWLH